MANLPAEASKNTETTVNGHRAPNARTESLATASLRAVGVGVIAFRVSGVASSVDIILVVEYQRLGEQADEQGVNIGG